MNTQYILTLLLIGAAILYLLRRGLHQWRKMSSVQGNECGGGCGCSKSSDTRAGQPQVFLPSEQLTLRQRPDRSK